MTTWFQDGGVLCLDEEVVLSISCGNQQPTALLGVGTHSVYQSEFPTEAGHSIWMDDVSVAFLLMWWNTTPKSNSEKEEVTLAWFQRVRVRGSREAWQLAAGSRRSNGNRKLRDYIFNHKHKAESQYKWGCAMNPQTLPQWHISSSTTSSKKKKLSNGDQVFDPWKTILI